MTQDFTALGLPVTVGMGLLTASGLGVNYNQEIASNGTFAEMAVLQTAMGAGFELTDRLSFGFEGARRIGRRWMASLPQLVRQHPPTTCVLRWGSPTS